MKAYIAAPFFNEEQIASVEKVKACLNKHSYVYFSPKDDNSINPTASYSKQKEGFNINIEAISDSDVVVAITDGKDMGTLFECGYAFAKEIPIIYIAFSLGENPFNLMLAHSSYAVCKDIDDLSLALGKIKYKEEGDKYEGTIE